MKGGTIRMLPRGCLISVPGIHKLIHDLDGLIWLFQERSYEYLLDLHKYPHSCIDQYGEKSDVFNGRPRRGENGGQPTPTFGDWLQVSGLLELVSEFNTRKESVGIR